MSGWRERALRALVAMIVAVPAAACMSDEPLERPTPLSGSPFRYPVELWDAGVEGETVLMVHVTALGEVDSAYVHRSSGHRRFDSAAVEGAYELRFTPGRRGDERVAMWAKLPVRFSRDDSSAAAVPQGMR